MTFSFRLFGPFGPLGPGGNMARRTIGGPIDSFRLVREPSSSGAPDGPDGPSLLEVVESASQARHEQEGEGRMSKTLGPFEQEVNNKVR